jgi:hypothetical protein
MSEILEKIKNDVNAVKYINGSIYFASSDKGVYKSEKGRENVFEKIYAHTYQVTCMDELDGKG